MPQVITDYDDIDWAAGHKIEADAGVHTLILDGKQVKLLLCSENLARLASQLEPYFEAGEVTHAVGRPKGSKNKPRGGRKLSQDVRKLIAWVDETGLQNRVGNGPAYRGSTGKLNTTKWLWDLYYEAHPEERDGMGSDRPDRAPAAAGDRG
jgi:hypothetical protein